MQTWKQGRGEKGDKDENFFLLKPKCGVFHLASSEGDTFLGPKKVKFTERWQIFMPDLIIYIF